MKTSNLKSFITAVIVASFFATMPSTKSFANNVNPIAATQPAQPTINVKVLGQQDEFVIIEIELKQTIDQNSKLTINDEKGDSIYEESVSNKLFKRRIKVSASEISKLEIIFSTPKVDTKKIYAINIAQVSKVDIIEIAKF